MSDSSANDPAGRDVPAEDSPVPAGPATLPINAKPWPEPNRLVLRASFPGCALSCLIGFFLMSAAILIPTYLWGSGKETMVAAIGLLVVALIMAWTWYRQAVLPRVTFDREAGLLTLGWRNRGGQRPLSSIVGVQVMQTLKQFGGPELNIAAQKLYQLNLILDDPAERRLNVLTCDLWRARSNARLIANFLGVPVLDSSGAPAAADADADMMSMLAEDWAIPAPVVVELGPDILLIRPRRLAFLFRANWTSLVALLMLLIVMGTQLAAAWVALVLVAGVGFSVFGFVVGMLRTLGRRARFDRTRGELRLGWLRRRAPRPLASVKAIEVVDDPQTKLNLLPDDPRQLRLTLMTDADAALVCRAAERLASFLGVPLLDTRRQTPGAAAVNPLAALSRSSLPAGKASIRGPVSVVTKGEDVLVLQPRSRLAGTHIAHALFTIGLGAYLGWRAWFGQGGRDPAMTWLIFVALLGTVSQFGALKRLVLSRDHFDRQTGLLTLGWFGLKGTYPLEKMLAVQLVPGGLIAQGTSREQVSYQLNLVLADAYQDRLNLTDDADLEWTRRTGQEIADFLGVPMIDQVADGE